MLLTEMRNTESTMQFIYRIAEAKVCFVKDLSQQRRDTFSFSD